MKRGDYGIVISSSSESKYRAPEDVLTGFSTPVSSMLPLDGFHSSAQRNGSIKAKDRGGKHGICGEMQTWSCYLYSGRLGVYPYGEGEKGEQLASESVSVPKTGSLLVLRLIQMSRELFEGKPERKCIECRTECDKIVPPALPTIVHQRLCFARICVGR